MLQLENINIESLANKTIILDNAGAYKNLKTKVEDLFRFGRHHNIQVIYLAHYAKDVPSVVRENCSKLFITKNNADIFFETIVSTYSMKNLIGNNIDFHYLYDFHHYDFHHYDFHHYDFHHYDFHHYYLYYYFHHYYL